MQISYPKKRGEIKGTGDNTLFLANNKYFFSQSYPKNTSQYQGFYHFDEKEWELHKIIESLNFEKTEKTENHKDRIKCFSKKHKETYFLDEKGFLVETTRKKIILDIDMRRVHEFDDKGRIYEIKKEKDTLIITYTKYHDNNLSTAEYKRFLAITNVKEFTKIEKWIKKEYEFDTKRNTHNTFYVFRALEIIPEKEIMCFAYSDKKEEAIKKVNKLKEKYPLLPEPKKYSDEKDIAKKAINTLIKQVKKEDVIFAGLPWFYQVWSRDELISITGATKKQQKKILLRNWNSTLPNGFLKNRWPDSQLGSADGIGWLYKRTLDAIDELDFSKQEKELIAKKTKESLKKREETNMRNDLIHNGPLETWMDTHDETNHDMRSGARIEIQALHLCGYKLLKKLGEKYDDTNEKKIKNEINNLITDGILRDGKEENGEIDMKTRPNIFLAHYINPDIADKTIWQKTFDHVIERCWLNWGGFSSIAKNHYLFQGKHTGIDNKSYHRGDSWYFINNIAAICFLRLDKELGKNIYKQFTEKILKASTKEMLYMGLPGQCAEISSANEQESNGCLAQAWSSATLLELMNQTL